MPLKLRASICSHERRARVYGIPVSRLIGFCLLYLLGAQLGQWLSFPDTPFASFWPPIGIYLWALLMTPVRAWIPLSIMALLANLIFDVGLNDRPWSANLGFYFANLLGSVTAVLLLRSSPPFRLNSLKGTLRFLLVVVSAPTLSALIGSWVAHIHFETPINPTWRMWWAADCIGALIVTPLLLSITDPQLKLKERIKSSKSVCIEWIVLVAGLSIVSWGIHAPTGILHDIGLAWPFMVLPFITWSALRFGLAGVALTTLVPSLTAIYLTTNDKGVFFLGSGSITQSATALQAYIAIIASIGLALAATFQERIEALESVTQERDALESRVQERTAAMAALNTDLLKAKQEAEEASRAKSNFLANMSHEIRTPLGAIVGFAELMLDPNMQSEERRQTLQTIIRNGQHLARLINDILDLSKVESEKLDFEYLPFALRDLISDVMNLLRLRADEKGLCLSLLFENSDFQGLLLSDPTRLRQILMNIIGNAIKFTEQGYVLLKVRLHRVSPLTYRLEFLVEDTGIGLTPEQQTRLFQPFVQADATMSRRFGGTGLGIVLARHLARGLGGDVELVQSAPGTGTTFRITIQAQELPSAVPQVTSAQIFNKAERSTYAKRVEALIKPVAGARILVVDDAQDNRLLLTRILSHAGFRVEVANDGLEALEILQDNIFALMVLDIQMPGIDGFEVLRRLGPVSRQLPVIALTAHALKGYADKCLAAGFADYLSKPVDRLKLLELVARHCSPATQPRKTELIGKDPIPSRPYFFGDEREPGI